MSGVENAVQTVVFGLSDELFALPVATVREILDDRRAFRVPGGPAWLIGLTDVRGRSVPMVDLRVCLGLTPVVSTPATRVLVVEAGEDEGNPYDLGLVVDRVVDVSTFTADAIEAIPDTGSAWRSRHVAKVLRRGNEFVGLLELRGTFGGAERNLLEQVQQAA